MEINISPYIQLLREFIKRPNWNLVPGTGKSRTFLFLKFLVIQFLCTAVFLLFSGILQVIAKGLEIDISNKTSGDNMQSKYGYFAIILVVLLAPVLEECAFRLWLSFKKWHVFIASVVVAGLILNRCIHISEWDFVVIGSFAFVVGALYYLFRFVPQQALDKINMKYGKILISGSIVAFYLVHMGNFMNFQIMYAPLYLLMYLPVLVLSFFSTFYRQRLGFIFSILIHMLVNSCATLIHYM